MVLVIKTALISYIPFALVAASGTSPDWKEYLRSTPIWEAMERYSNLKEIESVTD